MSIQFLNCFPHPIPILIYYVHSIKEETVQFISRDIRATAETRMLSTTKKSKNPGRTNSFTGSLIFGSVP